LQYFVSFSKNHPATLFNTRTAGVQGSLYREQLIRRSLADPCMGAIAPPTELK